MVVAMEVAFGWKAHSGWAALVVIGNTDGELRVVDRRRVELVEEQNRAWAGAPFHAADELPPEAARTLIERAYVEARLCAARRMRAAVDHVTQSGQEVVACAVLTPPPMPDWSIEEIRAVHFRMHKAEGMIFPHALASAAGTCALRLLHIAEKKLAEEGASALSMPPSAAAKTVALLGKALGPPWGADQKNAALAAIVALRAGRG